MHLATDITLKEGLMGGLLLGASASLFMYFTGKITGLSGIVEGLVTADGQDWNVSYLVGLLAAGFICRQFIPESFGVEEEYELSMITLIAAGIISGFGTRLSGGCTSGHGLCGLGRFSPRSLTSVLLFMITGAITAKISRLESIRPFLTKQNAESFHPHGFNYLAALVIVAFGWKRAMDIKASYSIKHSPASSWSMHLISFVAALLFGLGLCISGMSSSEKVIRFLDFSGSEGWDPTLASVLGGGLALTSYFFPYMQKMGLKAVISQHDLSQVIKVGTVKENLVVDWKLVVGSVLFGMGWGLIGVCPGPGIVNLGAGQRAASVYFPSLIVGILLKDKFLTVRSNPSNPSPSATKDIVPTSKDNNQKEEERMRQQPTKTVA